MTCSTRWFPNRREGRGVRKPFQNRRVWYWDFLEKGEKEGAKREVARQQFKCQDVVKTLPTTRTKETQVRFEKQPLEALGVVTRCN